MSRLIEAGEALRVANEAEAFASAMFPESYSGVALIEDSTQAVVYLTTDDGEIREAISEAVPGANIQFEVRGTTQVSQLAAHEALLAALPELTEAGITIGPFGPDPETGAELVKVLGGTEEQLDHVERTFGPAVIAESTPADYRLEFDAASRISDSPAWNGGDFISDLSQDCTSGIPTHNGAGQQFLVTNAHCFELGARIYNYSSAIPLGSPNLMGHVAARDQRSNYYDAELISASASSYTFTGPSNTIAKATFAGAGSPVYGALVCVSGAFEGENCLTVLGVNSCLPDSITGVGRTLCAENYYYSSNNYALGQGNSGGPVYSYVSGGVRAMGVHNLRDPGYNVSCVNWTPRTSRKCSGHGWFVSIGQILSTWGLTVN
jgi:hypothetical protein